MRKLIVIVLVIVLLGCGWWVVAAYNLKNGVETWFADRQAEGWQADLGAVDLGGFPTRVSARLDQMDLADPQSGLAMRLPDMEISFRTAWPGDMRVNLPGTAAQISTPDGKWTLLAKDAQADLNLHPGPALELEGMALNSGAFLLEETGGFSLLGGAALTLSLLQRDAPEHYALNFDVTDFTPGDEPRAALALPRGWPLVFDVLTAKADITFDRAIDRLTLEEQRPQPQTITLDFAEARWGTMRLFAAGDLTRDARGYADGTLTIKAENWEQMLDLAVNAGVLPGDQRPLIERILKSLANSTGVTSDLDVTILFEKGLARIGFIPIGRAPSMIVR